VVGPRLVPDTNFNFNFLPEYIVLKLDAFYSILFEDQVGVWCRRETMAYAECSVDQRVLRTGVQAVSCIFNHHRQQTRKGNETIATAKRQVAR
jgi:hypothetical protein